MHVEPRHDAADLPPMPPLPPTGLGVEVRRILLDEIAHEFLPLGDTLIVSCRGADGVRSMTIEIDRVERTYYLRCDDAMVQLAGKHPKADPITFLQEYDGVHWHDGADFTGIVATAETSAHLTDAIWLMRDAALGLRGYAKALLGPGGRP